jgi:SAM-dependent methyltransferase
MNLKPIADYYANTLERHGATPQGADWNSAESQQCRFQQLARLWTCVAPPTSINDYGCGFGAMRDYLRGIGYDGEYRGFDIVPAMVDTARARSAADPRSRFVTAIEDLAPADYTVASGIFNVKLEADPDDWRQHIFETLHRMRAVSTLGFAFNVLTLRSDPERRRAHLHYASATELFDYCQDHFSRYVAALHDYPLYEFTILVRLQD